MNLGNLTLKHNGRSREVDPLKLFGALTLRGSIENVWEPQAQALRDWHSVRTKADVAVELATGGGKTLVGLIMAQSLVNETQGCVLYVCPTSQLVEQTAARAEELGIPAATYTGSTWLNRSDFDSRTCPCLTNYASVFNGKSIFYRESPSALIFDDAHVAGESIRQTYSLRLAARHGSFKKVANLFRNFFVQSRREQTFDDAMGGDPFALLFVPMFEVIKNHDELYRLLIESEVEKWDPWAWEHLKQHLHCCSILISGTCIELSPPVLPIQDSVYFDRDVRRIYMTATLPLQSEFIRTFGMTPTHTIRPDGKSGEAQKLFLMAQGATNEEQQAFTKSLIAKQKACIITPGKKEAKCWAPDATLYDKASGHAGIVKFAESKGTEKIVLAARFDGIDLPGKACRLLVLDGLPKGTSLFRTFQDQSLAIEHLRKSSTAIRLTQAVGRIFRSNTDHGAVVVCGYEIQRWLRRPDHQALLPSLLQRQVQLGYLLLEAVEKGEATHTELLSAILKGDPQWDGFYNQNLGQIQTIEFLGSSDLLMDAALCESCAFHLLWQGHPEKAEIFIVSSMNLSEPRSQLMPHGLSTG